MNLDALPYDPLSFRRTLLRTRITAIFITLCCGVVACNNEGASSGEQAASTAKVAGHTGNIDPATAADSAPVSNDTISTDTTAINTAPGNTAPGNSVATIK
ncbi:MAG: hypothetical protein KJO24_05130, partial [Gammaproteobacteria bacterium]|nr:hypothetical protein [Gammaproteobacteria bacterium]